MKTISAKALAVRACFGTCSLDKVVFCIVKGPQEGCVIRPGDFCFWCLFCVVFEVAFLTVLLPTWLQHGPNLGPKRPPKSRKNYKKMDHILDVVFD